MKPRHLGARGNPEKGGRDSYYVRIPGRRSFLACSGLLYYRPYRTSVWLAPLGSAGLEIHAAISLVLLCVSRSQSAMPLA